MRISDWISDVCSSDLRLSRHGLHAFELLEFSRRLGPRFLAKLGPRYLGGQFRQLVAAILAFIPEFTLNRFRLFVEIIFTMCLLHLAIPAATDCPLVLKPAKFALHKGENHFQPFA